MSPSADTALQNLTIASWNVHMGLHNDGGRNDVVGECVALDADVLVLQEAWWYGDARSDLTRSVAEATGMELHEFSTALAMKRYPAQWTVAVLTRVPATRRTDLPMVGVEGATRPIVRVQLDDSGLIVAGAHLEGIHALRRSPRKWHRQRRTFASACRSVDVLCGDLNMWGPVVEHDAAPLRRAVLGRTWPAWRPHSHIDHILVGERIDVLNSQVMDDCGSDHRAVRATVRPKPGCNLRSNGGEQPSG